MDLLLILTTVLVGFFLLGALATFFGVDSRESISDDWARQIRP